MRKISYAFISGLIVCFSACSPQAAALPTKLIASTTPNPMPTATTVWFPPTPTFTRLPNATIGPFSTPGFELDEGDLLLKDDFVASDDWSTGKMEAGSIAYGKNELSLGVSSPEGYLFSLRKDPALDDFYLEITVNPSICRGKDEYGVLFRVTPAMDFFRFGLNCAGEARLDRFLSGTASSPHPPAPSGAVPPGAPSTSRLGIFASRGEMKFFVNGEQLFTINDSSLLSGKIGVYARAAGGDMVTINFSELIINTISK